MTETMEMLTRILGIAERISQTQVSSSVVMGIFAVLLAFGILNCVLGYRLLRFWVMLFGFAAGAGGAFFLLRSMEIEGTGIYLGAIFGAGIALGVISFLIYKLGIFILGAGIAWTLSIYILHPTTSAVFFVCVLAGAAVGALAVRYAREVIIVGTSLLGGVLAGFSLSKLGSLPEIPYSIGFSFGFVLLGLLVQFMTNKREKDTAKNTGRDVPEEKAETENASWQDQKDRFDEDAAFDDEDELELYDDPDYEEEYIQSEKHR